MPEGGYLFGNDQGDFVLGARAYGCKALSDGGAVELVDHHLICFAQMAKGEGKRPNARRAMGVFGLAVRENEDSRMILFDNDPHRFEHARILLLGPDIFEAPIKWSKRSLKQHEGKAACRRRNCEHEVRIGFSRHRFDILGMRLLSALDGAFQDTGEQQFLLFGGGTVILLQFLEHHIRAAGDTIFHFRVEIRENMMGRIAKEHFAGDGDPQTRRAFPPLNAGDDRAAPTSEQAGQFGLREAPRSSLAP